MERLFGKCVSVLVFTYILPSFGLPRRSLGGSFRQSANSPSKDGAPNGKVAGASSSRVLSPFLRLESWVLSPTLRDAGLKTQDPGRTLDSGGFDTKKRAMLEHRTSF